MTSERMLLYLYLATSLFHLWNVWREGVRLHRSTLLCHLLLAIFYAWGLTLPARRYPFALASVCFVLFGLLPQILQLLLRRHVAAGHWEGAARIALVQRLLLPGQKSFADWSAMKTVALRRKGRERDAEGVLRRFRRRSPPEEAKRIFWRHLLLGALHDRSWAEAVAILDDEVDDRELLDEPVLGCLAAKALLETDRLPRAVRLLDTLDQHGGATPLAWLFNKVKLSALAAAGLGEAGDWASTCSGGEPLPPWLSNSWRGLVAVHRGDRRRAEEAFRALRSLPETNGRAESWLERQIEGLPVAADRAPMESRVVASERPREAAAGRFAIHPVRATYILMALNLVCLVAAELLFRSPETALRSLGANVPARVREGEWWRLSASVFLHAGWLHLGFNLLGLFLFGSFVERLCGSRALFVLFLISGMAGSGLSALLSGGKVSVGASGGVLGLLGAGALLSFRHRHRFLPGSRRKLFEVFLFLIVANTVLGFVEPTIDHFAHLGGLVAGMGGAWLLHPPVFSASRSSSAAIDLVAIVLAGVLGFTFVRMIESAVEGGSARLSRTLAPRDSGYALRYPDPWEPRETEEKRLLLLDPAGGFVMELPDQPELLSGDPRELFERRIEARRRRLAHEGAVAVVVEAVERSRAGEHEVLGAGVLLELGGRRLRSVTLLLLEGSRGWWFHVTCRSESWAEYGEVVSRVLATFEVTG